MENKSQNINFIPSRVIFKLKTRGTSLSGERYQILHNEYISRLTRNDSDTRYYFYLGQPLHYNAPDLKWFLSDVSSEHLYIFRGFYREWWADELGCQ